MKEVDVYAHANPFFVQTVRMHGGRPFVLDVGCWNGALGAVLIRDCDAIVDGIERNAAQAERARDAGYRRVEVIDLDHRLPVPGTDEYDFVLFGDVLEHLLHPQEVLSNLASRVKAGGCVMVSLPNIGFVSNRISHLLGRWDYKDYGILDRTHLRFFTKRTMKALLEGSGLRVRRVRGYVGLERYPWILRAPARLLGRAWPSLFAIQIVLEAERS